MKVYVDELPKSCERCPFHDTKYGICDISGSRVEYFGCHSLTPLSDYTKQVRKEVCKEIKEKVKNFNEVYLYPDYTKSDAIECILDDIEKVLDQIQGE